MNKTLVRALFVAFIIHGQAATARLCTAAHLHGLPVFHPSLEMALVRSEFHRGRIRQIIEVDLAIRDVGANIKTLSKSLGDSDKVSRQEAGMRLAWYVRFAQSPALRRMAFNHLRAFHHEDSHMTWTTLLKAGLYEADLQFRSEINEFVDRSSSRFEKAVPTGIEINRRALDQMTSLSSPMREHIWQAMQRANTWRAVAEIEARVEQIPTEIKWLEDLQASAKKSARHLAVFQNAVKAVTQRRLELGKLLFEDQFLKLYFRNQVEFIGGETTAERLNTEKFATSYPPFTPDQPFVVIRIRPGQTVDLARVYGGTSVVGGAWFFPSRPGYMKSSVEARDTGALPDANTTEFWRKVTFGAGEEFFVGPINPQKSLNGEPIPQFGRGGLGGDIQFWRDPIIRKDGQEIKKPYFSKEQTGVEVSTIQHPKLQAAQSYLRMKNINPNHPNEWYVALDIYHEVRQANDKNPHAEVTADLRKMMIELHRFHHRVFVDGVNRLFSMVDLPRVDTNYFEGRLMDMQSAFVRRDRRFYSSPSPESRAAYLWSSKITDVAEQKFVEWSQTGKPPAIFKPESDFPLMADGNPRTIPENFIKGPEAWD